MKAKGLDTGDKVLANAISLRLIHALRIQARIGKIVGMGREKAAGLATGGHTGLAASRGPMSRSKSLFAKLIGSITRNFMNGASQRLSLMPLPVAGEIH